jgi:hypothetical protein
MNRTRVGGQGDPRNLFKQVALLWTPNGNAITSLAGELVLCQGARGLPCGQLARAGRKARPAEFSVSTFPSQASPTSFPPLPARPPDPGLRGLGDQRRRIPVGPRSAKSAEQDGKLQKSSPLCPPPPLSRNSRPSALTPQLIHSRGAGLPGHVRTRGRTAPPAPPLPRRTGPYERRPSPAG